MRTKTYKVSQIKSNFFLIVPRSLYVIVQIHQQKMGKDSLPGILEELWAHKNSQVIDLLFRIKCNPVHRQCKKANNLGVHSIFILLGDSG